MNSTTFTLFKIAVAVGVMPSHQEIPIQTMQNILQTLKDQVGISRCTFWQIHEQSQECEIIAGLPVGDHGIGKKYLLTEHRDILFIVKSSESFNFIKNPYKNELTYYFRDMVEEKKINSIGYFRAFYSPSADNEEQNKKNGEVLGVLVIDACGDKNTLDLDEQNACRIAADLIAARLISFEDFLIVLYREWEDNVKNPITVIGGLARRLQKIAEITENLKLKEYSLKIIEEIEKMEKNI